MNDMDLLDIVFDNHKLSTKLAPINNLQKIKAPLTIYFITFTKKY